MLQFSVNFTDGETKKTAKLTVNTVKTLLSEFIHRLHKN